MYSATDHGYSISYAPCAACGSSGFGCCDGQGGPLERVKCFQDGADFYRDSDGSLIVTAPVHVPDWSGAAASDARSWFQSYCIDHKLHPVFV